MKYNSLLVYYFMFFLMNGFSTFVPKYYGEIGLTDGMIGILTSIPTIVAVACSPMIAVLTDRVPKKRYMLTVLLALLSLSCFLIAPCRSMGALLLTVSLHVAVFNGILPLSNAISLEYTREIGKSHGRVRLMGTVGYQVGALVAGAIMSKSLNNLYQFMGAILIITVGITFVMPNVKGHQHANKEKVPLSKLFADKHVRWMYGMLFFATVSTQFYMAFFTKHLGDLGMSNSVVSWVTLLSVIMELPFLYFGDKIAKKTNVWNWIIIGLVINSVRWIGLSYSRSVVPILLFQLPSVCVLACYEYFPALYLNRKVPEELSGSAQNMLALMMFGVAKVVGTLLGGQICERIGIPAMFLINGVMGLIGVAVFWPITRKLIRKDTVLSLAD